jgi:hypothetical protein
MREVVLSRELVSLVDDDDYARVSEYRWRLNPAGKARLGYAMTKVGGKTVYMHRFILGASKDQEVDHKDRDPLNNQKSNLRIATRSQQAANTVRKYKPEHGYRGVVTEHKRRFPYRALIKVDGRRLGGPYRPEAEESARDYDRLAFEHFGEFAITNFPRSDYENGGRA